MQVEIYSVCIGSIQIAVTLRSDGVMLSYSDGWGSGLPRWFSFGISTIRRG